MAGETQRFDGTIGWYCSACNGTGTNHVSSTEGPCVFCDGGLVRQSWRPIETAPKDGTRVLLATDAGVRLGLWFRDSIREGWMSFGGCYIAPTHWMPLPDTPTDSKEDDDG